MKLKNVTKFSLIALAAFSLNSGFCQTTESASFSTTEVIKLSQAGTGDDVVLAYIKNSQIAFNLSADDILTLKNAGISSPVITAMLQHDGSLRKAAAVAPAPVAYVAPQPAPAAPAPTVVAAPAPATVVVQTTPPPPPAPQVEVITVAPGPDYYWAPGCWSWSGHSYIWIGGSWGYRPHGYYWGGHYGGYYGGHYGAFRHGH